MPGRLADALGVATLAMVVTAWLAAPVLRAPSERVFGAEIVGRHHDPFTVMQQFERPINVGVRGQPITDVMGALIARVAGGVAAYNWVVLLSFPLAAVAAFLLASHLALSRVSAIGAAMAFAFAPFHLAHAAYHPHIAQVQWVPLYLLALWRCLDAATPPAVAALGAAALAVTLSNFYGGFIAAVITPIAIAGYWAFTRHAGTKPLRRLVTTIGSLGLMAAAGCAYWFWTLHAMVADGADVVASRRDLFRYSANWWSYLVPPVEHPILGVAVARFWADAGISEGLLEQQVSVGWGVVALGVVAIAGWWTGRRPIASLARVPILVIVAVAALVCSLSPERTLGAVTWFRPSALLYEVMPMFRSYARFGVVVQLMAVLLAGIGLDLLWRSGTRRARTSCLALVFIVVAEYAVLPSSLWRDTLPTAAHRWVMQQPGALHVLDCLPLSPESASVPWLTHSRVTTLGRAVGDCTEPNLAQKLAALDYTHLLVRHEPPITPWVPRPGAASGFRLAASFDDGQVFAVETPRPAVYTATITGFSPRERDREWSWQWMGARASWIVVSTTARPALATLEVEVAAFGHDRQVSVWLDGREVQTFVAEPARSTSRVGPLTLSRGAHELAFRPAGPPTIADAVIHNRDYRPLSVAIGTWTWHVAGGEP